MIGGRPAPNHFPTISIHFSLKQVGPAAEMCVYLGAHTDMFSTPILAILVTLTAHAGSNTRVNACGELGRTPEQRSRCLELSETYDLTRNFILGCANFSDSDEMRMDCLKSGSTEETLRLCRTMNWSEPNTISCLRFMQNPVLARHCKKFSDKEETQVRCLRFGREISQTDTCADFSAKDEEKLDCLKHEIPAMRVHACKKVGNRLGCLSDYVAGVERDYQKQRMAQKAERARQNSGRGLASPGKPEKSFSLEDLTK